MIQKIRLYLVVILVQVLVIAASTYPDDGAALQSLKDEWENEPPSWNRPDPCVNWEGINCNNNSRVVSIILSSIGLSGQLSGDIQFLAELQILDLSYNKGLTGNLPTTIGNLTKLTNLILVGCGFSGQIPDSIGSLQQLTDLSLNSNDFIGEIPATIGRLSNLFWLDLADNKLTGSIPISNGSKPGLDKLINTKHFHFGRNQLSGVPAELFTRNMTLIHLLLENNRLIGSIPDTLGLVQSLEVVRLDNNSLSGPVPGNLNNLTKVGELYLSNNKLTGSLPILTGMDFLNYVDMSNNSFEASDFPSWFPTLKNLTTIIMERTQIRGQLPADLFSLPQLQTVKLRNNRLDGTLNIGSNYSNQLQLIDLQQNSIESFPERPGYTFQLILVGNRYCENGGNEKYCTIAGPSNDSYSTPVDNCLSTPCSFPRVLSPICECAYPYTGTLVFRALSFSNLGNQSNYELLQKFMMNLFKDFNLPVDCVSLSNPRQDLDSYVLLDVRFFPSGQDHFNRTGISAVGNVFSKQIYKPPPMFGPYYFIGESYRYFEGAPTDSSKPVSASTIIGAAVGGSVLVMLLLFAGIYAFCQKKRANIARRNDPFASWDPKNNSGDVPQLKGAKCFSFEELKKYTNNFSEINGIGTGGYGKVYRGTLPNGQLVAIKRAQQGSMQGAHEFKTEIELLSRVHHKNVVSLVGFCFELGEQMLVYEYIPNGTLKDSLSGKSGIRLDWMRRLKIAVGAARGLQYLHDLANPPIIHRDVKSDNILLDERLHAKVADFGVSKPIREFERGHVTTQVKGTMGYLDPEYYMTQKLTEKSDVYSFGVLLLELISGKNPIEKGKYIVREVSQTMIKSKDLYNLQRVLDPTLGASMPAKSLEKFVDLAMRCVEEEGVNRPTMSDVVKEIEKIMEIAGLKSASTSSGYEGASKEYNQPYSNESLFAYSGVYSPLKLEPK